jgi:hypothetical protein
MTRHPGPADPQEIYARWLELGTRMVFAFSLAALALYLSGILAPAVPLRELPRLWTLSAEEFLRAAGAQSGPNWFGLLRYGDYLNLLAIALFALLSLVCAARMIPAFLRSGEKVHAALAVAQVVVLLAAALNLFPGAR